MPVTPQRQKQGVVRSKEGQLKNLNALRVPLPWFGKDFLLNWPDPPGQGERDLKRARLLDPRIGTEYEIWKKLSQ